MKSIIKSIFSFNTPKDVPISPSRIEGTIEQAKADTKNLQKEISQLISKFEEKYGHGVVVSLRISRWNGSNESSGWVSRVFAETRFV